MPSAGNSSAHLPIDASLERVITSVIRPLVLASDVGQALASAVSALLQAPSVLMLREDGAWRVEASAGGADLEPDPVSLAAMLGGDLSQPFIAVESTPGGRPWVCVPLTVDPTRSRVLLIASAARAVGSAAAELTFAPLLAGARAASRAASRIMRRAYRFSRALGVGLSRQEQYQLIVDSLAGAARARIGALALKDPASAFLSVVATSGYPAALVTDLQIAPGVGIIGGTYVSGRPVVVSDVATLGRPPRPRYRTASFIAVPLRARREVLGVACLADRTDRRPFDRADLLAVKAMLAPAALALVSDRAAQEAEALAKAAALDPLTRLLSRQHFWQVLQAEVERARRHGLELSLLMLDLDEFKAVNDTYGHLVGDAVLREVGDVFRRSIRAFDICARYGGDEFVIVLPASGAEQALRSARRISRAVAMRWTSQAAQSGGARVTVSVGAAVLRPSDNAADLVARADRALYSAKASGRNIACLSDD